MERLVVICDTDPQQRGPGTDHIPVLTTLDLEVPAAVAVSRRNYRATDWSKFREALAEQLVTILSPCALSDEVQFQEVVDNLTVAIQTAIKLTVPMVKPSPHSCHWWNDKLLQLKKCWKHNLRIYAGIT